MSFRGRYVARINRVVDHIDAHLDEPLDLGVLAAVAHFSPWHFHRVFRAIAGETLAECVRRRRLEVAAGRLAAAPDPPVAQIAAAVGFASAAVFTRAFRARFGVTPTDWRAGAWRAWAEARQQQLSKIRQAQRNQHQAVLEGFRHDAGVWPPGRANSSGATPMNVEVKSFPERTIAYLRHVGPYGGVGIPQTWQRFGAWCAEHGLTDPRREMYGVSYDDPDVTPPEQCRYDCGIEVPAGSRTGGEIGQQRLAGGRYACARVTVTPQTIPGAWGDLCAWLPDSGYQADDRPMLEVYAPDFVMDPETGAFEVELCMPVKRL